MIRQKAIFALLIISITVMTGCVPIATSDGTGASGITTQPNPTATTASSTSPPSASAPAASPTSPPATAAPTPTPMPDPGSLTLELEPLWPNMSFKQPLYFAVTENNSDDAYVVERTGRIWIMPAEGQGEARVFLDLSSVVDLGGQEKGLLGLAFHPQYSKNGYFYVNYTNQHSTVIARYSRLISDNKMADPDSGQILLTFEQPFSNHNGGHLAFGPDDYLYIAAGDGGSTGDPQNNAQDLSNLLGKILRIDVDHPSGDLAYGIPPDNPLVGNNLDQRQEIYAYGLRNPWRFSFDGRGQLWVADVGQDRIEEINLVTAGGNYGWSAKEGSEDYRALGGVDLGSLIPPVYEYHHNLGESITGGYVYTGQQILQLRNTYIYGDFTSGRIWALWFDETGQAHNTQLLDTDLKISSFGLNNAGEMMVVDFQGTIFQIIIKGN